jgi:hypothetical protein
MAITPTRVAGAAGARFRIVLAAAAAEATDPPRLEVEERRLELKRTGPGKWSAVWAPGSRPAGRVLIRAHIPGDLESERFAELGITPLELTVHVHRGRAPRALSSGRGRLSGAIGLALGMTHNLGELVAPRFGLELGLEYRLSLGFVGARLLAGYGWATQRVSAPGALPDAESTVMLVPLGGALSYRAPLPYLTPYVMWGCLAQVVRTSNRAPYLTPERKRTDVVFAVLAVAGASRRLGPGRLFLQLGYQWSKVENEDVDALAGGMILEGGWRLEL